MAQNDNYGSTGGTGSTGGAGDMDDEFGVYDVRYYRADFEANPTRPQTHTYEQARTGYQLGHTAAANPSYQGRPYTEVEVELERSYQPQGEARWEHVRDYARRGFEWRTLLGGLAVAAGGWWAGKQLLEAFNEMGEEDEKEYRTHFETYPSRPATLTYDRARTGYALGHVASRNPTYTGRTFDEVEPEIRRGFSGEREGQYDLLRDFCRYGYERGTSRRGSTGVGGLGGSTGLGDNTRGVGDTGSSL
jgi:hypothetical protein